jgi:hypothetical protein
MRTVVGQSLGKSLWSRWRSSWYVKEESERGREINFIYRIRFQTKQKRYLVNLWPVSNTFFISHPIANWTDVAKDLSGGCVPNLLYLCMNYIFEKGTNVLFFFFFVSSPAIMSRRLNSRNKGGRYLASVWLITSRKANAAGS